MFSQIFNGFKQSNNTEPTTPIEAKNILDKRLCEFCLLGVVRGATCIYLSLGLLYSTSGFFLIKFRLVFMNGQWRNLGLYVIKMRLLGL